ncbi:MAG: cbb3-type cytochrome c oxidase subunit I [Armatimonadota bacterium]
MGLPILSNEENSAARRYLISSAVWMVVGTLWGMASAIHLTAPDLFANIPWLSFGRIRPAHTNVVMLGFVTSGLIGAGLYFVPLLLKVRLQGERLANLAMWLWNAAILGGVITLPAGMTQSREYAELIWELDLLVVASVALLLICFVLTVLARQENTLYVSVWYVGGAIIWTALLYPLGNVMWRPDTGSLAGVIDAIWHWFYGHNVLGLLMTPLAIAVLYYMIPRLARAPLYSHTLSLVGFWSLLAFYTHIGTHHLLQAPVPTWLKTISIVDSVAMVVPVLTVLINLWLTMRGRLSVLRESVPGKFVFAGSVWYLLVCLQGPLHSLPSVQRYVHFTNWVVGHAHIAVLGFTGMIALGGLWYVLPKVSGRKLYSDVLVDVQYWLVLVGLSGFFLALSIAGLVQGGAWLEGEGVYRTLPMIFPYMAARAMFGVLIVSAAFIGLYNVVMTLARGERVAA